MVKGIFHAHDIPIDDFIESLELVPRRKGEKKKKNDKELINIVTAFDIETTTIYETDSEGVNRPHSFMYVWQFQFGRDYTIMGRTWEDFDELRACLREIQKGLHEKYHCIGLPRFVCYIHNLAFEWQFIQGVYRIDSEDCFFRDVRKPLYVDFDHMFIFRCSYLHSNMSLAKFGEAIGTTVHKLSGNLFDYNKIRYPWTPLSDYELEYCVNDVRVLEEAIRLEMQRDGDNLRTIPLTSTGYVRRDCKEAIKPLHYSISQLLPDQDCYMLLRRCFRGGDTHANRFYVGQTVVNVEGHDMRSAYPTQQLNQPYPMGPFQRLAPTDNTLQRVCSLIAKGNAVIGDYIFKGIRLKNPKDGFPYIPTAKSKCLNPLTDNGRVLSADMCQIALTEVDLEIILDQYQVDSIRVDNAYTAIKAMLPISYRNVIKKYFELKTALKGVEEKLYYYQKSKNKLNAVYGMSAQQPLHPHIIYRTDAVDQYFVKPITDPDEADAELKKAPFPYQWGVYTTAYCRKALREGLKTVGTDKNGISKAIYCDTDSVKSIGTSNFDRLNRIITARSRQNGAFSKDKEGNEQYIGIWENEGRYSKFRTLGAKRYCYEDAKGIHVTVSGVTKDMHYYYAEDGETILKKIPYAVEELGPEGIENFKEGMIWTHAGGTAAVYNDTDDFRYTDPETGMSVAITPNVCIVPTTYTMTVDDNYADAVDRAILWKKWLTEFGSGMIK